MDSRHYGLVFITAVSLFGYAFPALLSSNSQWSSSSQKLLLLKSFASGLILGVALLHLLPDAVEDLDGKFQFPGSLLFLIDDLD
jgi:hypothetical protein